LPNRNYYAKFFLREALLDGPYSRKQIAVSRYYICLVILIFISQLENPNCDVYIGFLFFMGFIKLMAFMAFFTYFLEPSEYY